MWNFILQICRKIMPVFIKEKLKDIVDASEIIYIQNKQKSALKKLSEKKKIKAVFMAIEISVWKYDEVFRLMQFHPRFEPVIFVCPMVNYGRDIMLEKMSQCVSYYMTKGYNVICSYDKYTDKYVDLRKELNPDILLYTNPYKGLIDDRYYISNFKDLLTVYVSYYFTCGIDMNFNTNIPLYNIVWRKYVENSYVKEICLNYAKNRGRNAVVTGYPGIEPLIDNHTVLDPYAGDARKRIIWAPHHTLESSIYGHSCFLKYAEYFLDLASKYKEQILFIFKPHPLLKGKLYNLWGKEKTDYYYNRWENGINTSINEGDYVDLFLSSDAMIHDSGSFVVEYLYVNKPVMRTINDVPLEVQFNEFALSCLNNYYMARTEQDIEHFIQNVINGNDSMKEQRTKFVNEILMPKGSPSQNIIDDILDSIDNQILYRN